MQRRNKEERLLLWTQWAAVEYPGSGNGQTGGNAGQSSGSMSGYLLVSGTLHHEEHMHFRMPERAAKE